MSVRALQRSCACGGTPGPTGECAQCRARRLAQESVQQTLQAPARPLDATTRGAFERTWGHDFSAVRVHADEDAARSAEAVGAHAYTVGHDVVFGRGRYEPGSERGTQLLAHELTHVRQQEGAPSTGQVALLDDAAAEAEAERAPAAVALRVPPALQRAAVEEPAAIPAAAEPAAAPAADEPAAEEPARPAPPEVEAPEDAGDGDAAPEQVPPAAPPPPPTCDPDRALTWADFTGRVPRRTRSGARTSMRTPRRVVAGVTTFRAVMNHRGSWVKPKYPGSGARATNGCAPEVARCQRFFGRLAADEIGEVERVPAAGCPATVLTSATATTRDECETEIGATCDADAPNESARLLAHEQGHFDIACVLAGRANDALAAGTSLRTVRRWLARRHGAQQAAYDNESDHGCDDAQQAAWETAIQGGLTAVPDP